MSQAVYHSQGNPGEQLLCVFRHPNAEVNKRLLGPFIEVLRQGTNYTQHVDEAPRRSDCITAIEYIARHALKASIFPTDLSVKIHTLSELPPHMIANGWKVCSIFLHEVRSGDVILVAKVGMETLSHAALFMSPQNIFHVNLTDRTGVVCSVRDFQESYDIYLTRDQIFNPTPSPTAKKLKTVTSVVRSNTCPDLAGSLPTPSLPLLKRGATDFAPRIPSPEPKSPTVDDKVPTQKV